MSFMSELHHRSFGPRSARRVCISNIEYYNEPLPLDFENWKQALGIDDNEQSKEIQIIIEK
jgi:hypothetical protein